MIKFVLKFLFKVSKIDFLSILQNQFLMKSVDFNIFERIFYLFYSPTF